MWLRVVPRPEAHIMVPFKADGPHRWLQLVSPIDRRLARDMTAAATAATASADAASSSLCPTQLRWNQDESAFKGKRGG